MTAARMFGLLLKLYPPDYRAMFGGEMLSVLDQAAKQQNGLPRSIGFFALEALGILWGAAREWAALLMVGRHRLREEVMAHDGLPEEVQFAQSRVDTAIRQMVQAISLQQFEKARRCSDLERKERDHLHRIRKKYGLGGETGTV
jgi:hypothetical protein